MIRIPTLNNRFLSAFAGFAGLLSLAAAGCGGGGAAGGGSAASVSRDTRAAAISTVQGARKVARIVGTTTGSRAETPVSSGAVAASLTPTLDTLRRIVRPLYFIGRSVSSGTQTATFDSNLGLYRVETVEDARVTAQYFEDSAKTRPAGTTEATVESGNRVAIRFDVSGGATPIVGNLKVGFSDTSAQTGTVEGEVQDPRTGRKVALKMQFSGDMMRGEAAISSVGTVKLSRIISYSDGRLEADVNYGGTSGHLTQGSDLSGSLSFNETSGKTVATYDGSGAGTLQLTDGSQVAVSSFDAGS